MVHPDSAIADAGQHAEMSRCQNGGGSEQRHAEPDVPTGGADVIADVGGTAHQQHGCRNWRMLMRRP